MKSRKWQIFAGVISIIGDLALVVGLVLALIQGREALAIVAVLGLILFELGRIKGELRRHRPQTIVVNNEVPDVGP